MVARNSANIPLEPARRLVRHHLQRARLLEKMRHLRHNDQLFLPRQADKGRTVQLEHNFIIATR
jgi:hypothetical protein